MAFADLRSCARAALLLTVSVPMVVKLVFM